MRGRRIAAGALATVGLLLLPAAVMAHWATVQLVETERFVAALAPLADDPAVQDRIILEVSTLVDEQVDISGVTSDLLDGLGEALGLGDRARDALDLVSEPIAAGVRSLVDDVVGEVVRSPAFSSAWASSVDVLHTQTIRLLSGAPDSLLELDRDGTLRLPLGPIVADVRTALIAEGVPFAAAIPETDRSIVLAEVPNLAVARVVFQVGVTVGVWLPWIAAGLIIGSVLLAPRRPAMLRTLGVLAAVVMGLLAVGFALGRTIVTAYVGPDSSAIAGAAYDAVLGYATTTIVALLTAALLAGLAGWWLGSSPVATRARTVLAQQFTAARARRGFSLGAFSVLLHRHREPVRYVLIALAAVPAIVNPPLSMLSVLASAALAAGLLVIAELLMSEQEPAVEPAAAVEPDPALAAPAKKPARRPARTTAV